MELQRTGRPGAGREEALMKMPRAYSCLIVAHRNPDYVASVVRLFRRFGWDVREARDGSAARQLAREHAPAVVVLDADAKVETGWLTCAKLVRDRTPGKVILVGRDLGPEAHRLTRFVGAAALVGQDEGAGGLLGEAYDAVPLPAVG